MSWKILKFLLHLYLFCFSKSIIILDMEKKPRSDGREGTSNKEVCKMIEFKDWKKHLLFFWYMSHLFFRHIQDNWIWQGIVGKWQHISLLADATNFSQCHCLSLRVSRLFSGLIQTWLNYPCFSNSHFLLALRLLFFINWSSWSSDGVSYNTSHNTMHLISAFCIT